MLRKIANLFLPIILGGASFIGVLHLTDGGTVGAITGVMAFVVVASITDMLTSSKEE